MEDPEAEDPERAAARVMMWVNRDAAQELDVSELRQMLDSDFAVARRAAVKAFEQLSPEQAAVPLASRLEDPDSGVRTSAIKALGKCGEIGAEHVPALQHVAEHDNDPRVRAVAAWAVKQLS